MKNILFEVKNYVGFVTLNREKAMNAFNYDTLCELASVVESIRTNSEVRAVVFLGAGEKAFSVGADLKERKTLSEQEVRMFTKLVKFSNRLQICRNQPSPL